MNYFKRQRYRFLNKDTQYMGNVALYEWFNNLPNHPDPEIRQFVVGIMMDKDKYPKPTQEQLAKEVVDALHYLKLKTVLKMMKQNGKKLVSEYNHGKDCTELLKDHQRLQKVKMELCKALGINII